MSRATRPAGSGNSRNGRTTKKVHTEVGQVEIAVSRDRNGTFEPQLIPKHVRRLEGFNEAIVSLYARGMTTGDIQGHLRQLCGAEVSRELISKITDAVGRWPIRRIILAVSDQSVDVGSG